jgi:hypothetical protein
MSGVLAESFRERGMRGMIKFSSRRSKRNSSRICKMLNFQELEGKKTVDAKRYGPA